MRWSSFHSHCLALPRAHVLLLLQEQCFCFERECGVSGGSVLACRGVRAALLSAGSVWHKPALVGFCLTPCRLSAGQGFPSTPCRQGNEKELHGVEHHVWARHAAALHPLWHSGLSPLLSLEGISVDILQKTLLRMCY